MKFIKLTVTIITISLFFMACSSSQTDDLVFATPYANSPPQNDIVSGDQDYFVSDNLELLAVGELLEKSKDAQDFEFRLNSDKNVNNLDLNGDGYVDYISVSEYENRDKNQRGFTLYNRFGQSAIQEIARIIFDRDRNDNRGARVLLYGNEQIYGDNYYYETNQIDKNFSIADWAFSNRNSYYQSPYYYDNYPKDYEVYRIVETPVYQTRIQEFYPKVIFVKTVNPTVSTIKIKSPYHDRSFNEIFGKLAKPSKDQAEFRKHNPNKPQFVMVEQKTVTETSSKDEHEREKETNDSEKSSKNRNKKNADRNKPNKAEKKTKKVKRSNNKVTKPANKDKKGDDNKPGQIKHST